MCPPTPGAVQTPWLSIVGIGAAGWDELSPGAQQAVLSAPWVIGGERHLAMLPQVAQQSRQVWPSPLGEGIDWIKARRHTPVCVLASGDPFWFGVGATLARHVDSAEMQVWPQPSALSLAAARMGWALQHVACVSVHGRALDQVMPYLAPGNRLLVLSWDGTTPAALARLLVAQGFGASQLTVLAELGGDAEQRHSARARDWTQAETAALNIVALDCVAEAAATPIARSAGRPDTLFDNDGQLTKREVRAVVLGLLAPGRGERLWDIGAGSGAIGIEWMLADRRNRAIAIEARSERAARIRANAGELGVPALECIEASAPAALAGLATPDAIFIGGGLTTPGLLAQCWAALASPRGRIVASSVTLEGDAALAEAQAEYGGTLRRIGVERMQPLGRFRGWQPQRSVILWCSTPTTEDAL